MPFLLDTNIVSHIVRHPRGAAAQRFRKLSPGTALTSIIVAAEARFGVLKRSATKLAGRLEELFEQIEIAPFEAPADLRYAELRVDLERRGKLIGSNDMLIAAHALALDCTLITANEGEFRRVPGLRVENWLA
jgi:tRNA(fMet)-specific endonuclease VapC